MHRRKTFLIYPPSYKPGDGFKVRHSKFQARKVALRMGAGAGIDVCVQIHPAARKSWISSTGPTPVMEVSSNETAAEGITMEKMTFAEAL